MDEETRRDPAPAPGPGPAGERRQDYQHQPEHQHQEPCPRLLVVEERVAWLIEQARENRGGIHELREHSRDLAEKLDALPLLFEQRLGQVRKDFGDRFDRVAEQFGELGETLEQMREGQRQAERAAWLRWVGIITVCAGTIVGAAWFLGQRLFEHLTQSGAVGGGGLP